MRYALTWRGDSAASCADLPRYRGKDCTRKGQDEKALCGRDVDQAPSQRTTMDSERSHHIRDDSPTAVQAIRGLQREAGTVSSIQINKKLALIHTRTLSKKSLPARMHKHSIHRTLSAFAVTCCVCMRNNLQFRFKRHLYQIDPLMKGKG